MEILWYKAHTSSLPVSKYIIRYFDQTHQIDHIYVCQRWCTMQATLIQLLPTGLSSHYLICRSMFLHWALRSGFQCGFSKHTDGRNFWLLIHQTFFWSKSRKVILHVRLNQLSCLHNNLWVQCSELVRTERTLPCFFLLCRQYLCISEEANAKTLLSNGTYSLQEKQRFCL